LLVDSDLGHIYHTSMLSINTASLFLTAAVLFLAAQPLPAQPAPATNEFKPFVFLHAGDPEIGSPDLAETTARFASLARRAETHGASFVVCSGDVTHDSTPEQWEAIRKTLSQFKVPVFMVPGNHDFETASRRADYRRQFGPEHFVLRTNNCEFIFANSNLLPYDNGRLWATEAGLKGSLAGESKAEQKWLEDTLRASRQHNPTHLFLVLHYPVADTPPVTGKLADLLTETGVKAVLCGHRHVTAEYSGKGFEVFLTPGTAKLKDRDPEKDKLGLGYRCFKVYQDKIEQEFIPLK
jgi:3',5'-cyclic AMP phosphodiesterase CpdA